MFDSAINWQNYSEPLSNDDLEPNYGFKVAAIDELKKNSFKEWFEVGR